jgi:hypothetical protein
VPALQIEVVHVLPSSGGTSVLNGTEMIPPVPLHWFCWQSPGDWLLVTVPEGAKPVPHMFALHVRISQSVSEPGQSFATLHATQAPDALQTLPPFCVQLVPVGTNGCWGEPAWQTSVVHWLPSSAGTSVLNATSTMSPVPSHWFWRQSPGVCCETTKPAVVNEKPQTPAPLHVLLLHSSSTPGQSAGTLHPTHWPAPSQTSVPPQLVPEGSNGFVGTPAVHTSSVQALLSSGRSVSRSTVMMLPEPSHWSSWQSPSV